VKSSRSPRPLPSLDRMYELFRPNFRRGELMWRKRHRRARTDVPAGAVSYSGKYTMGGIDGKAYFVHRILYAMYHKVDPGELQIDHVNLDGGDNCVDNLRAATGAQNRQNSKTMRNGLKGAYRSTTKTGKQWVSAIMADRVIHTLGYFDTEQEAHDAYAEASKRYHGEFGRTR